MRQLTLVISLFCISMLCHAGPAQFDRANKTGHDGNAKFSWGPIDKGFSLSATGVLIPKNNPAKTRLRLPLHKDETIKDLLVQVHDADILLVFRADDGIDGRGFICRITWPQNTIQWCQVNLNYGINVSADLDSIYVGSNWFLARLNPKDGTFIWKHQGIYRDDPSFHFVCFATENDSTVIFNANGGRSSGLYKQVSLDRHTGKILSTANKGVVNACEY